MAKLSEIYRNLKRIAKAKSAFKTRDELRQLSKTGSAEEQDQAILKLNKSPRNKSLIRVRNRCRYCGRPRGTYRKFGLCRVHLREAAMKGAIPGLKKASW